MTEGRSPFSAPPTIFNRCNFPPWIIASREFQDNPQPLEIDGVRMADRRLFDRLEKISNPEERGQVFHDYVSVKFRLHEWPDHRASARSSLRNSYIQFIRNWGADSNGPAGALLKSWVEGRFGLVATFHGGRLADTPAARERYARDRMVGAAKTVGALMQLDLLYTFCQDELPRRYPGQRWITLYRGTHDPDEYALRPVAGEHATRPAGAATSSSPSANEEIGDEDVAAPPRVTRPRGTPPAACVQLNNLSSFTADREVAWEFGSSVWEVQVPLQKIVFFSGLLPRHLLEGESEFLVLGGDYQVRRLLF